MYIISYIYVCIYIYIWQRLKNIGLVTGPGGLFATRLATESGGVATNRPCDQPIEDYSTLHRGPRRGFVTEGPRQRFVAEGWGGGGWGDRDKSLFPVTAICVYINLFGHMYTHVCTYMNAMPCTYTSLSIQNTIQNMYNMPYINMSVCILCYIY